jgi:iron complex outermembrane receptor protein
MLPKKILLIILAIIKLSADAQTVKGKITGNNALPVSNAFIYLLNTNFSSYSDSAGNFSLKTVRAGSYTISISAAGYATVNKNITVSANQDEDINISLPDASKTLDEVVVTSQKKEEAVQNIPVSITVISARQVEEHRLWDTKELTAIVPNLYSGNPGDDRNVTSIRGIVTTSYDPAVTTYIDGVNQFGLDTYIASLNDIERIEVLRGPQGTLYGRNAMGGVINIITKQPTNATNGFAEVTAGNYGLWRLSAGIRTALVKNKLFFGVAGVFNTRNGFYNNVFNNTSFDKQKGFAGNYYLKFIPSSKWSILFNLKQQINRNNGPFPLVNGVEDAFKDPFEVNQNAVAKMIDNTLNTSLSVDHKGASFNFTSLTAWQTNHRYYNAPLDGDFSPADAVTIINDYGDAWNKVKVFTEEVKFTSPGNAFSRLKWTVGSYFFYQDNPSKQATHFGKDAALVGSPDSNFSLITSTKAKNTGIALYGQTSYALSKKLSLIAGLRYDYESKSLSVLGEYAKDGEMSFVTRPDTSSTLHFNAVSPKLGLDFAVAGNSNLFASYSKGYRTGGLTQLSSDPSQPPLYPYKPEYSNNFEVGVKNNFFQRKLRLNVTVFYTHVSDAQVPTLILPDAITVTKNTGKLDSRGAELEVSSTPLKGLQVDYNFGYTDATYQALKVSQNGSVVDLNGNKQIYTPGCTSMSAVQYSFYLSSNHNIKLVARGEWLFLGKEYFDVANTISQNSHSLFNARLGVSSKYIDIFFWSRNISDKKYIAYAYDFGAVHLGDPKTYGISVAAKF